MNPSEPSRALPPGLRTFLILWAGHVVSLLGTGLTGFALGVWIYQQTGSVTRFALIAFFTVLPGLVLSPLAGAVADRWDRQRVLMASYSGAGLTALALALLLGSGYLAFWHIYVLMGFQSLFVALQWPAMTASITLLVGKAHYGRASGMTQMGMALSQIVSPFLGAVLLEAIGIWGVVAIDMGSFFFAATVLLFVRIPQPAAATGQDAGGTLLGEAGYGWTYLRRRPGLLALLALLATANFNLGMLQALLTPLVLGFTTTRVLGTVLSVAGVGMLLGTLTMSVWGGPKRRLHGIFGVLLCQSLILLAGGLRPNAVLVAVAAFLFLFGIPILLGSSQAIWQSKVAPQVQGRVFAFRRMVGFSTLPLAYFVAGPLADHVFEPLLAPGGALADTVGAVIGVGEGRGVGLLFMLLGVLLMLALATASRYPRLRRVEDELPDAVGEAGEALPEGTGG